MKCIDLKKIYDGLKSSRASIEQEWDDITKFISPGGGRMYDKDQSENSIDRRGHRFDSTAPHSATLLASNIISKLISPATRWFGLGYEDDDLNKSDEAREWMDDNEDRIYNALQESNFNAEMASTVQDIASYSQGTLTQAWDKDKHTPGFKGVQVKEGFVAYDYEGYPIQYFRVMEWPLSRIVDKFGIDGLPECIRNQADNPARSDDRKTICYAVYKRRDKQNADTSKDLAVKEMPWGEKYFLMDEAKILGEEGGFYECPVYVSKWAKKTGSDYGFGPSQIMLETIRMLNKACELNIVAWEKVIDPCTAGTQRGVIGDLDLSPGGHTVVRSKEDLWVIESGANFGVSFEMIESWRKEIRDAYKIDLLMMQEGREMTAYEVSVRYQMLLELYSTMLTQMKRYVLNPVIENTFKQMYRNGQLLPMPAIVAEKKANMRISYVGAMAKAQRSDEIVATERWVGMLTAQAEIFPEMLDTVDVDELPRQLADLLGVPAKMLRSQEQINLVRKNREKAHARMQEAQIEQEEGKAMSAQAEGYQAEELMQ